ncbi:MAG: hypothetical protein JWP82_2978, partial [Humibacillus sp.]|nr:hypothetical protein [Humibacillus sp.]
AALALALPLAVSGCGVTDIPSVSRTVTVTVDAPAPSDASGATPVPTVTAPTATPTTSATTAPPTALAVGPQRGAPHSFDEAQARVAAATTSNVGRSFQSPSGNLTCTASGAPGVLMTCDVARGRSAAPPEAPCPDGGARDIGRVELTSTGARPVCNSDTIRRGRTRTLPYGTRTGLSLGQVACVSEAAGVTCVDGAGRHGFFLARGTFATF